MPINSQCGESQVLLSLQAATCGLLLDYKADPLKDKMLQSCISLILQDELQHDCHRSQVAQSINAIVCSWIVNSRHLVHKIQISFRFPVSTFLWVGILRWQEVRTPATNSTDQIDPTITMAQVLRAGQTQPETD